MGFFGFIAETFRIIFIVIWDPVQRLFKCCFPKSKKCIKGETILITGAGQGLGKELAFKLAKLGSTLVLWDINAINNEAVAIELRAAGHIVHAYKVDVTNQEEVVAVANQVKQNVGNVSIVINNAGVFSGQSLVSLSEHRIRLCFEVNVMAHFWILQQFLPHMLEVNKGHIVSLASIAGHLGSPYMTDYCSSKYGAVGLMNALYYELRDMKKDITLTTINPIIINTGLISNTRTRFPSLLPVMDVEATAEAVVNGILKEEIEVFVPSKIKCFLCILKCFSMKTRTEIFDYAGYGFDPVKQGVDNPTLIV